MRGNSRIKAVVVAVPARNEQDRIEACIQSILAARDQLAKGLHVVVSIAVDSPTDATAALVSSAADRDPSVLGIVGSWGSAGGSRRAAVSSGLSRVGRSSLVCSGQTWIATTDADSQVPVDWLTQQVRLANRGLDAVAGTVALAADADLTDELSCLFDRNYRVEASTHHHVHGANMGLRANAYLAAGGFPEVERSEDRQLWNALVDRGFRVISPPHLRVETSGRLKGRVAGGFADAMATVWV